jgi:hypothetical protein
MSVCINPSRLVPIKKDAAGTKPLSPKKRRPWPLRTEERTLFLILLLFYLFSSSFSCHTRFGQTLQDRKGRHKHTREPPNHINGLWLRNEIESSLSRPSTYIEGKEHFTGRHSFFDLCVVFGEMQHGQKLCARSLWKLERHIRFVVVVVVVVGKEQTTII